MFFTLTHINKKTVPNNSPEHLFRWIVLRRLIRHLFFWDLNQSENLSEIKPPLVLSDDLSFIVYLYDRVSLVRVKNNNKVKLCCNKKGHCFSTLNSRNVTVNYKWTVGLVDCQIDLDKNYPLCFLWDNRPRKKNVDIDNRM